MRVRSSNYIARAPKNMERLGVLSRKYVQWERVILINENTHTHTHTHIYDL